MSEKTGRRKARKPPVIADATAGAKLEAAAAAVGCTLEELANLAVEAGIIPPPGDGVTQRYTLQDLGNRLWASMQTVPRDKRAEWYTELLPTQRIAVVVTLRDQGYRTEVIAEEFALKPIEVTRIWNTYASELGAQVVGIRLDSIAGQVQLASERAQQMAIEKGDHAAFWRIEKEKVQLLQSIGIVDQAIQRVEVSHKVTNEQMEEIERIAALRNKQAQRKIEVQEVRQIEETAEAAPSDITDDYDEDD